MKSGSKLERLWEHGQFTVTAQMLLNGVEDEQLIRQTGKSLAGYVDAMMVPDNQKGRVTLSSLAGAALLTQLGQEAVFHLTCRDRNRIALQSDLMGARALGIHNVVCLSGDHPHLGNRPQAKKVYDLDSIQLIALAHQLREQGLRGGEIAGAHACLIGAVENPFADPFEFRVARLAKKFEAGADFVLTQVVFDLERFQRFMERVRDRGLHKKGKIIASLRPVAPAQVRELSREPGMLIPPQVIEQMEVSGRREAGVALCQEYLGILRQTEGISGVHIVFEHWEDVAYLVKNAGLVPRPEGLSS